MAKHVPIVEDDPDLVETTGILLKHLHLLLCIFLAFFFIQELHP